jgi:hypothetical protein
MFSLFAYLLPWGLILQAVAIIHFIRRRPDWFWLLVIILGGGLGALIYLLIEGVPDLGLLKDSFKGFSRRKRINELQAAVIDNPSAGNYEELGDLYFDEKKFGPAGQCYDRAITSRTDHPDPYYRRGVAALEMGDTAAAIPDLERTLEMDRKYDYYRALGLLAVACARSGQAARAQQLFEEALQISTASETQVNYAAFLISQGRKEEARQWAQRVLAKKATMPGYLKRRERPWFRRAAGLLKQV